MFKVSISQDFVYFRTEADDLETVKKIVTYHVVHACGMAPVSVFVHSQHGFWFLDLTRDDVAQMCTTTDRTVMAGGAA